MTGTTLNTQLKNLNTLMAYNYTITEEYINSLPDQQKLKINGLLFKAFLESSDITYETKDQQIPFVPTSQIGRAHV